MGDNGGSPASFKQMKMVIVGHVDHGKSTLVGRLMADTNSLPTGRMDFIKEICERQGKSFEFAFLMDAFEEEQEQGITIDTSQIFFKTKKRSYVLIDAPGHKEFLKNMVTGAASADVALLLIDASEGIQEQSRRHGYILKLLGLSQVAVVINKMDLVNYDPEAYFNIKAEYSGFLESLGIQPKQFIPVSAKLGINIAKRADEMVWYKGPTILEMLDQFEEKVSQTHLPLRFPIQDVYKFDERRILAGRIESGQLKVGDELAFLPSNKRGVVQSIEAWNVPTPPKTAVASQSIGITLTEQIFVERGEVASLVDSPPIVSTTFDANIFWMGSAHLVKDKTYTMKLTTQNVECEVIDFKKVIDASTLETLYNQEYVAKNDVAELTFKTREPVVFDLFGTIPETGRFVLVDDYDVRGGGIVTTYSAVSTIDKLRDEARHRDFNWVTSNIDSDARAYRNGHRAALILLTGRTGVGKAELARSLEEKLFNRNFQSYLLDGRNIQLGLSADIDQEGQPVSGEPVRRFGEVVKLFLDAGHLVISTTNAFNQEDHSGIRLLLDPNPVVEILITDAPSPNGEPDMFLTVNEAKKVDEVVDKIYNYLNEIKILTGHNYSI